ncbi:unnamed protein product [Blepharisma stoltei]|uniref:Secreted protein n=1 Tax=Blepharisma stoltei TaxID=1481888 RepID=A0AAU9JIN6_9CILI|nr:unnamed protein product [Blepharisma stoltei]
MIIRIYFYFLFLCLSLLSWCIIKSTHEGQITDFCIAYKNSVITIIKIEMLHINIFILITITSAHVCSSKRERQNALYMCTQ